MTREQEILARAMNEIDDEMIERAHAPRRRWVRVLPSLAAACLVVAVIIGFPYLREAVQDNYKASADAPAGGVSNAESTRPPFSLGPQEISQQNKLNTPVKLGGTTVCMTAYTENTATFTIQKTDSTPIYAAFLQNNADILGTTERDFRDNGVIIRQYVVRVYVDGGELQYTLPEAPGEYEVVIDFSSIRRMDYVMWSGVVFYAYIGEDGAPVDEYIYFMGENETSAETDRETVE